VLPCVVNDLDPTLWSLDDGTQPKRVGKPSNPRIPRTRKKVVVGDLRYLRHDELKTDRFPKCLKKRNYRVDSRIPNMTDDSEVLGKDDSSCTTTGPKSSENKSAESSIRDRGLGFRYVLDHKSAREQKSLCHDTTYLIGYLVHSMEYYLNQTLPNGKTRSSKVLLNTIRRQVKMQSPMVYNLRELSSSFEYAMRIKRKALRSLK
jgi:hypothetical protein